MAKYLISRFIRALVSVFIVTGIIMIMIYSLLNRDLIFANDPTFTNLGNNQKTVYKYRNWKDYGYIDYVTYADYIKMLLDEGEIDEETRARVVSFGRKPENDSEEVAEYVAKFTDYYESRGYTVTRLNAIMAARKVASGGQQQLFAYKDRPLITRLIGYFAGLFTVDNIHAAPGDVGERGLTFTWHDPAYGGKKLSPAIMGNGTMHKYLLYVDNQFPFLHQNLLTLNLGKSYTVNKGIDVFDTMTKTQGSYVPTTVHYPTGLTEQSADDLHSAVYVEGSLATSQVYQERFTDDYTSVSTIKGGMSKMGYSFTIGIIAVFFSYLIGLPLGIIMALRKGKIVDRIGTIYIVFITSVPSLSYIFLFRALGGRFGLPTTFIMDSTDKLMYVLPIISLMLPSVANLMRWLRRYMIDQINSDYVKFARSGGLSEGEIFRKHILKNAAIPIVHGVPASILGAMTGAIITERVYVIPGTGGLLVRAIALYDNGVIVGVALFYAVLSVLSVILGDVLMSMVDPRISFTSKAR